MFISVFNHSKVVSNAAVDLMCKAISIQLNLHVFPAFNLKPGTIKFFADETKAPGYSWRVYLIDEDPSVPGAGGYHQEQLNGKIDGYVMCKTILDNGGTAYKFNLGNPSQYSISKTLSHEVLETIMDRFTNSWYDNGNVSWCGEICDPVEQTGYSITVDGEEVSVSDFVFENFFNPYATLSSNAPFNYLKTLKEPFTLLPGGYCLQRRGGPGTEVQVFDHHMPDWRKEMKNKEFGRSHRRIGKKEMSLVTVEKELTWLVKLSNFFKGLFS